MSIVLNKISNIYKNPVDALVTNIRYQNYDSSVFRFFSEERADSLDFNYFSQSIDAIKQIVLSSACLAVDPRPYYKRLRRVEANQVLDSTKFNHTERGSFVVRLSCDVRAVEDLDLFKDASQGSVVRRTFENVHASARAIVDAIARDEVEGLIDAAKSEKRPVISANFCDALAALLEDRGQNSVELSTMFSLKIPPPPKELKPAKLVSNLSNLVAEIARDLKDEERPETDTFVGTVEELQGEKGGDGRRSGTVILALLLNDTEMVKARVYLDADHYAIADSAHMSRLGYVQIKGTLHPGRQPRRLSDIEQFKLVD